MSERQKDQLGCTLILNGDKGGRKKQVEFQNTVLCEREIE